MKKYYLLLLPLLLSACNSKIESESTSVDSSSYVSEESVSESKESETAESSESEESYESIESIESVESIESDESEEEYVKLNPMNEPHIARQYYLNHIGDIYSVWKDYRGKGVTVAVIDVNFAPYHEEFYFANGESKVSPLSASFITDGSKTTVSVGVDKTIDKNNSSESHGTFCAGVLGASINGKGVAGVAPDCELMLLRTDAKPRSIAKAFKYAADNGARVVTISIGSYYNYDGDLVDDGSDLGTIFDEPVSYCRNKGVVVCSAAGNGGESDPYEYTFPGCVDGVIGVGGLAANSSGEIWSGSSYNSSKAYQFVDVFAPSDMMFGCCNYNGKKYDEKWNGTSFASPIVAGLAALYFEKYPAKTVQNFENDLFSTSHKITTSSIATVDQLGYGRVDAGALLGIKNTDKVSVKVDSSFSNTYAYIWDSNKLVELASWPGKRLTSSSGSVYEIEVDLAKYDSIIFSNGSDKKTCDLSVSSFIYGNTYSVKNLTKELDYNIGSYLAA